MIKIREITAEETYPIRIKVLREGVPLPHQFDGDNDKNTFHLGAFRNNELVGVSSFMYFQNKNFNGEQYQLRGMATLKASRGLGVGKKMMEYAFDKMNNLNIKCLWCNARIIAVDFYKKLGLKTYGEMFEIKYVGNHYVMYKYL